VGTRAVARTGRGMLVTKREAAEALGLGVRVVERLLSRGVLRGLHATGSRVVWLRRAELEAWVAAGCPQEAGWERAG
jgi:excisionase family DNA binding protein